MTSTPEPRTATDGPNTHKMDAPLDVTSWTIVHTRREVVADDGRDMVLRQEWWHVPAFVVDAIEAEARAQTGCWEWQGPRDRDGYGRQGKGRLRMNRVAYQAFVGPIPPGLHVLHHCDNPPCVNPAHLWVGTNAENMADKAAKGRAGQTGEENHNHKLTEDRVRFIRAALRDGVTQTQVARELGVSSSTVRLVAIGETWAHVK